MNYPYTYNISPDFDTDAFWRVVQKLDVALPYGTKQEFSEDFLDGSLLKTYSVAGNMVRVECDWDIGAVFIDSEINLEAIIGSEEKWKFYQYRGHLFTGGICIKEFVDLRKDGDRKNEYRVFYINGNIATISRNAGQCDYAPVPPTERIEKYNGMKSKFYTIDYAELSDGQWIIIETGDGSVSGLSDFQDYREFYRALYYCFA